MTTLDFSKFKRAVDQQFARLVQHDIFRTGSDKDGMWNTDLASFPAGAK